MFLMAIFIVNYANYYSVSTRAYLVLFWRVPTSLPCCLSHSLPPTRRGLPSSRPLRMSRTASSKLRIGIAGVGSLGGR
jgi:hypothetical protein